MAVIANPLSSIVVVKFQTGTTPTGAVEIRQKSLNNVLADAVIDDIYRVAKALFSLSDYQMLGVVLRKNFELIEEV